MSKKQTAQVEVQKHEIFNIVTRDKKSYITIGNAVMYPETFATPELAKEFINSKPWDLLINATCYVMSQAKNLQPTNKLNAENHENI